MVFNKLNISISHYLGSLEDGVLVLLSIIYDNDSSKVYEGTYWYNKDYKIITLEEDLQSIAGDISNSDEYNYGDIIEYLNNNTNDYDEIFPTLKKINTN